MSESDDGAARDRLAAALMQLLDPAPATSLDHASELRLAPDPPHVGAYLHVVGQRGLHLLLDELDDLTVMGDPDLDRCVEIYAGFVLRYLTATIELDVRPSWPATTITRIEFADGTSEGATRAEMDRRRSSTAYRRFEPRRLRADASR